jgi:hypothetical protein
MLHLLSRRFLLLVVLPWLAAAGEPTAGDPRFDDRTVWPSLSGAERFLKTAWPKARLITWAHPGQSSSEKPGGLSAGDPANWRSDGKPLDAFELSDFPDLEMPPSDTPYKVVLQARPDLRTISVRHLTIGRNASLGTTEHLDRLITGNLWIKPGGWVYSGMKTRWGGVGDVFVRNDNPLEGPYDGGDRQKSHASRVAQYFHFAKEESGSVEVLGAINCLDEFGVDACTLIVGPGSRVESGRNAEPKITRGGTIAVMDGGVWMPWSNNWGYCDLQITGTVQGGLPERPLRADAFVMLHYKNWTDAQYEGPAQPKLSPGKTRLARNPSLLLWPGSALRTFSASPATARLVITPAPDCGIHGVRPKAGGFYERNDLDGNPQVRDRYAWADALPRGIDIYFGTNTTMQGVRIDGLRPGGLLLAEAGLRQSWTGVVIGAAGSTREPTDADTSIVTLKAKGTAY